MKNKTILLSTLLIALFSVTLISGCKKEEDTTTATCTDGIMNNTEIAVDCGGGCKTCGATDWRIKTFSNTIAGSSYTMIYTYDSLGRINSVYRPQVPDTSTYSYSGNTVTYTMSNGMKDIYTLNNEGYATTRVTRDSADNIIATLSFTYDSEGHLISYDTDTIYIWADGNIIVNTENPVSTNTYFTDKLNTTGNENMGMRFRGKSSKNLISSTTRGSNVSNYTYQYDTQGRVIGSQASGSPIAFSYTYY